MKRGGVIVCVSMMLSGAAMAGKEAPAGAKAPEAETRPEQDAAGFGSAEAPAPTGDEEGESIPTIVGPKRVSLGHDAAIDLPAGMILLEEKAAQDLMRAMGNQPEGVVAVIAPPEESGAKWLVVIEASDMGYVSDDDADELDASAMLEQFKQGTLEQNKQRVAMGKTELFVDGWSEPPRYDRLQHHLVWGLSGHDTDGKFVNFFTRFLGRNGYLSVDLIDAPERMEQSKAQALSILTAIGFEAGYRYEDHVEGDRDSGIGLTTLVLGGTAVAIAKKGGILVTLLLVLKKGFVVIAIAIGAFLKRLLGRRKPEDEVPASAPDAEASAPPPDSDPPADPGTPSAG